jgi:hypothetical protein
LAAVAVTSGLLVLVSDRYVLAPVLPLLAALGCWVCAWGSEAWYSVRSGVAHHPVVRAELPWSVAVGKSLPAGWYEAPVLGSLHRTAHGWVWRPSPLIAAELPVLAWREEEVVASTLTPLWGPGLPERAQLRLYLRGHGTVEFVVWHPERLLPASLHDSALTS